MTSKHTFDRRDLDTSNCDYISEVFREQLSELEYSRLLADSEEKELTNQQVFLSGYGGTLEIPS